MLDQRNEIISSSQLVSGHSDTKITIKPETSDGELLYVPIEFTDREGVLKPYVEQRIDVEVKGGGLIALGSALCKSDETFDLSHHRTYRGRALAIIKPEEKKIKIIVSSNGYDTENVEVNL